MKKHFTFSNVLLVIVIVVFLHKPSRIWLIRQVSFSPSIEKETNDNKIISNYNWKLKGLNTPNINFSDLKGKVIFLNFWATWCPPCVAELPSIQSFYNDYKNDVAFVFISNENWSEIDAYFKEKEYDFPVYQGHRSLLKDLPLVNSIPRTFIIDKNGSIRTDKSGAANWNSTSFREQIDALLK